MIALITLILTLSILVGVIILRGWVFMWLWHWFLVPFGLPEVPIVYAIGIMLFIGFLRAEKPVNLSEEDKWEYMAKVICAPLVILGLGYITTLFL